MLEDVILVWGESVSTGPLTTSPRISVAAWSDVLGLPWLRWDTSDIANVPDVARTAKAAFVNLFWTEDSIHIQQIREVNPNCFITAMPDPSIDLVLANPAWMNMHRQMAIANMIGGRTQADCDVYGTLLNKPTTWLPSPAGPIEWFLPFRDLPKEDYILTLDHQFAPANTYCNVAAVAAAQRHTGMRIVYVGAMPWTRDYAALAGLECEWRDTMPFEEFVNLTARALMCIDMYAAHSYGRQQVLCGMVGTPILSSVWCTDAPGLLIDPFHMRDIPPRAVDAAQDHGRSLATDEFESLEQYSFENSRARIMGIVERIGVAV